MHLLRALPPNTPLIPLNQIQPTPSSLHHSRRQHCDPRYLDPGLRADILHQLAFRPTFPSTRAPPLSRFHAPNSKATRSASLPGAEFTRHFEHDALPVSNCHRQSPRRCPGPWMSIWRWRMAWRHRERTKQRGARGVAVARGFSLTGSFVSAAARSWMLAAIPTDEPANERRYPTSTGKT